MIFDLIAGTGESGPVVWTPAVLFANGEQGFWLDSSDYSTMFQNSTGTVPITGSGQPVGMWKNKIAGQSGNYDAIQATSAARPATALSSGKPVLAWDGVDDKLATITNPNLSGQAVTFALGMSRLQTGVTLQPIRATGSSAVQNVQHQVAGDTFLQTFGQSVTLPVVSVSTWNVMTCFGAVNVTPITGRLNGVPVVGSTPTTGNIGGTVAFPNIAASLQYQVSQIVYINRVLTPTEITLLETFIGSKQ
jgi:hypothetical protein